MIQNLIMKIVGLTGGIGSGKTTIAKWFQEKSIPVYNSDNEAKRLMNESAEIKRKLVELFGEDAYVNNELNRKFISSKVFENKDLLEQLNQIVHPEVFKDFKIWIQNQTAPFVVKEAAILFESGSYHNCDYIVSVVADEEIRIQRVMERDGISSEQVLSRIKNQWTDELRIVNSDFIIRNNEGLDELEEEFETIYNKLLKKVGAS